MTEQLAPPPPANAADLSPAWLEDALAVAGLPCAIEEIVFRRVGESLGFTGQILRLEPRYSRQGGAPDSLVAKLSGASGEQYYLSRAHALIEPEARFYRTVAPTLTARVPQCYYAEAGEGGGALLLEDVSALRNGDQRHGTPIADCRLSLAWLAGFHAQYWGADPTVLPSTIRAQADEQRVLAGSLQSSIPVFEQMFGSECSPAALTLITRCMATFGEGRTVPGLPATLIHFDFKPNNIFFGPDGETVVLDWQSPNWGSGVYDLMYFLGSGLTIEQRRAWERELVGYYAAELAARGIAVPAADAMFDLYRRSWIGLLAITGLVVRAAGDDPASVAFRRNRVERALAAIDDLQLTDILD